MKPTKKPLNWLLIAGLLATATSAASAQTSTAIQTDVAAQAQIDTDTVDAETRLAAEADDVNRHCLRHTGSRITARDQDGKRCIAANGRVYTRDDIERTGEIDLATALRRLDPTIY